jgi:hypothetical protein
MSGALPMWTVFERPADYRQGFVARRFEARADGSAVAALDAFYGPTLESVRARLPAGLYRIERDDDDDPCIVETWL